jgi:hypothetical protein
MESGTDASRRTIFAIVEFREVNRWRLINLRRKRKQSVGLCTSSSTGSSKAVAGERWRNPKQAIAIGLREAGASKYESKKKNRENLKRTKARERHGATEKDRSERSDDEQTGAELYTEAKRRGISGRSKMSKRELEHALQK